MGAKTKVLRLYFCSVYDIVRSVIFIFHAGHLFQIKNRCVSWLKVLSIHSASLRKSSHCFICWWFQTYQLFFTHTFLKLNVKWFCWLAYGFLNTFHLTPVVICSSLGNHLNSLSYWHEFFRGVTAPDPVSAPLAVLFSLCRLPAGRDGRSHPTWCLAPGQAGPRLFRLAPHSVSLSHHHHVPFWFGLALCSCLLNATHTFTIAPTTDLQNTNSLIT